MKTALLVTLTVVLGLSIASAIKGEKLSFEFSICLATSCSND
jgi:hypothetical protein